jgi:chromosome segregation ATPase
MIRVGWPSCLALLAAVAGSALALQPAAAQPGGDRAAAEALIQQVEADEANRAVASDAVHRARAALDEAAKLRGAGDEAHAKAADGLAREWAETARDLTRAASAEATAADVRRKALEAQAQLERSRTLVEEGITRVGRLRAELDEAERSGPSGRKAVESHEGDAPSAKPAKKEKATAATKASPGAKP